jgi:hypothetical protein
MGTYAWTELSCTESRYQNTTESLLESLWTTHFPG